MKRFTWWRMEQKAPHNARERWCASCSILHHVKRFLSHSPHFHFWFLFVKSSDVKFGPQALVLILLHPPPCKTLLVTFALGNHLNGLKSKQRVSIVTVVKKSWSTQICMYVQQTRCSFQEVLIRRFWNDSSECFGQCFSIQWLSF